MTDDQNSVDPMSRMMDDEDSRNGRNGLGDIAPRVLRKQSRRSRGRLRGTGKRSHRRSMRGKH
jgi:hypothetical protein